MSEIKGCNDPLCGGKMQIVGGGEQDNLDHGSYLYNLYICDECESICKEDLWDNPGEVWLMTNGRIRHYIAYGEKVLDYRPPGFPSAEEEKKNNEKLRLLCIEQDTKTLDHIKKYLKIIPQDHYQRSDLERRKEEIESHLNHLHSQTI